MDFAQVESKYKELRREHDAGALTEDEFKAQLEELMIEDEEGKWWIIGYETGNWYYHDGAKWVQSELPKPAPVAPLTPVVELQRVRKLFQERGFLTSILLTAIGGAISWAIGLGTIGMVIGSFIGGAIGGAIGGLITGLALRRAEPSIQWQQVLVVTIGGAIGLGIAATVSRAIGLAIGWAIGLAIGWTIGWAISWAIGLGTGGAIGGLITGLALRQADPSIQWQQVLIVTIVWAIGWAIGGAIALVSNWLPIGGAIGGAIGGGVTLWQLSRARRGN